MNYRDALGRQNLPAAVRDGRGRYSVAIGVRFVGREWPKGRVVLGVGDERVALTPNHARRLVSMIERAIERSEERR